MTTSTILKRCKQFGPWTKKPNLRSASISSSPDSCTPRSVSPALLDSPPPVDAHVGRAGEPGVEDVDAADGIGALDALLQGGVVVEPESLSEPVHGVHPHAGGEVWARRVTQTSSTESFKGGKQGS